MKRLNVSFTSMADLMTITRSPIIDGRGFFERMFCAEELSSANLPFHIVQANRTVTVGKGVVRGMHFQELPYSDAKIVSCLRGRIFDVAVDLRCNSSTFLRWHAEELSAENGRSIFIPKGFAHGFQTLEPDCEILYFHNSSYSKNAEAGIHPLDPKIAISWPLPITDMSQRDQEHQKIAANFQGLTQ